MTWSNDVQANVVDPQSAAAIQLQDQRQKAAITRSEAARDSWIFEIESQPPEADGYSKWTYWDNEHGVRNVFERTVYMNIGGGLNPEKDIVCTAVSVNFGHRLAQQKLLGQSTATWQFLGAGNKTGTIVLTAGNEKGREALRKLRGMYQLAQKNARMFRYVPESACFTIRWFDSFGGFKVNNILALANVDKVIVTDIQEQTSDGQGADVYSLVMEFVTYEVEEEGLTRRGGMNMSLKLAMMRKLLIHLKAFQRTPSKRILTTGSSIPFTIPKQRLANRLKTVKSNNEERVRRINSHHVSPRSSVLVWEGTSHSGHWIVSDRYRPKRWFADLVLDAHRIVSKYKTFFGMFNHQVPGSEETWRQKFTRELGPTSMELFGGPDEKGFVVAETDGSLVTHQSLAQAKNYFKLTRDLDKIVRKAMKYVGDHENFKSEDCFGPDIYNELVQNVIAEAGECYADLDIPPAPGLQGLRFSPEFYVYDDSLENAVVDATNDPDNLEKIIASHIDNQVKSLHDYTSRLLFGNRGNSVNAARIRQNKINLNEALGSEYGFLALKSEAFAAGQISDKRGWQNAAIAEGVRTWNALTYDALEYVGLKTDRKSVDAYIAKVNGAYGDEWSTKTDAQGNTIQWGSPEEKRLDGYLNMVIADSAHLEHFVDGRKRKTGAFSEDDTRALKDTIKHSIFYQYDENDQPIRLSKLEFGPDKEQLKADGVLAGEYDPASASYGEELDTSDPHNYESDLVLPEEEVSGQVSPAYTDPDPQYIPPAAKEPTNELLAKQAAAIAFGTRKKDISMRRAYPTFKIYFIEEDSKQSSTVYRAFDDFYSYSSVQEIKVIRSRKVAADLAIIRLTNAGGKLLDKFFERSEEDIMDDKQPENTSGLAADTDAESPFSKMMLAAGVAVQIRLGYASDPDNLETVFLGQITEVMPSENAQILEIVCQGYGAELESVQIGDLDDGPIAYSTQSALSAAICNPAITHFGRFDLNQMYNPAAVRTQATGGKGWDTFSPTAGFKMWLDTARDEQVRRFNFLNEPQDDNIYAPPIGLYLDGWDTFWNNAAIYRPLLSTPWEIFKEHELRHPGYISLAVPYGHSARMTMFFGARGQNYWKRPVSKREAFMATMWTSPLQNMAISDKQAMLQNPRFRAKLNHLSKTQPELAQAIMQGMVVTGGEKGIGFHLGRLFGRYVPFRNYHMFTSEHHIIKNEIRTNAMGTYNTVEIRYCTDDDIEETDLEETKELIEEIQMGANAVYTTKLNDKIPENLVRKYEEAYPSCVTEYMAQRYAQGLMIRGLRDVYRGELCVIGEETLKPYDIVMIQDNINDMYGPVEVEQVVHIFNRDTGFISIITPDLCVDFNEFTSKGMMDAITQTLGLAWMLSSSDPDENNAISRAQRAIRTNGGPTAAIVGSISPMLGAAMLMHWDQTGSPYVITPVNLGGKPMMGLAAAPEYGSWFQTLMGDWQQWCEDFRAGWEVTDVSETLMEWSNDVTLWGMDLFGAGRPF